MRSGARKVFFDVNISYRLCKMIAALEEGRHVVEHASTLPELQAGRNRFGNSTPDVEWIEILAADAPGWVALSGDIRIIDTPEERRALQDAGLLFFAFDDYFSKADFYGQAAQIVQIWPQIVQLIEAHRSGIFVVRTKKLAIDKIAEGQTTKGRKLPKPGTPGDGAG